MKKIVLYTSLILITSIVISNPGRTLVYASESLKICYEIIIPSLFPFFVCSGLLIYSGICNSLSRLMKPVMKPLFNINGTGACAFILGIISGYPLGAVTACQLYEGNYLSKSEAERLLAFCNNSGPLFILASVGISMFYSLKLGLILYISHILSAITVGLIMRNYKKDSFSPGYMPIDTEEKNIGEIFSTVLSNSINSILTVCGAVIFCGVISKSLLSFIPIEGTTHSFVLGLMEFVSGISELSKQDTSLIIKLMFASWLVGFAGFSVHLQVMAIVSKYKLSLKPYIAGKILHGLLSSLYTFLFAKLSRPILPVFSGGYISYSLFTSSVYNVMAVAFVIGLVLGVSLLLFIKESKKLKRKMIHFISLFM